MKKSTKEPFDSFDGAASFTYSVDRDTIARALTRGDETTKIAVNLPADLQGLAQTDPERAWARARLRSASDYTSVTTTTEPLTVVDLFSGSGGLSFGVKEAAAQFGRSLDFKLAADMDKIAVEVYRRNLDPKYVIEGNVDSTVDFRLGFRGERAALAYPPEVDHPLLEAVGEIDVVVGGPPCRGHSNLNNRTRRADDRNSLYLTVPAIAIALKAKAIIIENVQAVLNSRPNVVAQARQILEAQGYGVDEVVLEATGYGVAQTRKRHFLIAVRDRAGEALNMASRLASFATGDTLTIEDAIGDLENVEGTTPFDTAAGISDENQKRIDFLFANGLFELPNSERPDCHKDGHTYPSVYGRLRPGEPAGTITGGFLSPGRGRFTHYSQRRGLTPHEGARIQGFPDFYEFKHADGSLLLSKSNQKLIGDAVPPPLASAVALATFDSAFNEH